MEMEEWRDGWPGWLRPRDGGSSILRWFQPLWGEIQKFSHQHFWDLSGISSENCPKEDWPEVDPNSIGFR